MNGATTGAPKTFADLQQRGEQIEVKCQKCWTMRRLSAGSSDRKGRRLSDVLFTGKRFTCACGGIGLPTIKRLWTETLTKRGQARAIRQVRS